MVEIRTARPADMAPAFAVRRRVFVDEQGVPAHLEFDAHDASARHLVVIEAPQVLGTLRMRAVGDGGILKIERVAVLGEARGRGLGRRLMLAALDEAAAAGAQRVLLHAQVQARPFYERLGFVAHGATFEEDGILHVAMSRDLESGA